MESAPGRIADQTASFRAFTISTVALSALFVLSIYVVLPKNVLSTPTFEPLRPEISAIWPQGWGFFTKDPDSQNLDAYQVSGLHDFDSLLVTPQGSPRNLMGLARSSRAQGPELAILVSYLEPEDWTECTTVESDCLTTVARSAAVAITNTSPIPTVCGDVLLAQETPTPWAYRSLLPETFRVAQVAHALVDCPGNER